MSQVFAILLLFTPTIFWAVIFASSYRKEPRQFRNAIWFALLLITAVGTLTLLALAVSRPNEPVQVGLIIALIVLIMVAPLAVIVFLLVNTVIVIRREGLSISALLPAVLALLLTACIALDFFMVLNRIPRWLIYVVVLLTLEVLWMVFTFAALLVYSTLYRLLPRRRLYDYIVIHGAGLQGDQPTPLLRGRIDKAVQLWRRQDRRGVFIVSGGRGADEVISEADAMRRYLTGSCGVPDDAIVLEDRSTTTLENLVYSKEIMDRRAADSGPSRGRRYRAVLVTSDYHVFRACEYAHTIGLNADGLGSRTTGYYWPTAFIREFVAISKVHWWPYAVIALIWTLIEVVA